MKFRGILRSLANANHNRVAQALIGEQDKNLSFIAHNTLPELYTLTAAPDQVASTALKLTYNPKRHSLEVTFKGGEQYIFNFRENDIMVLSPTPFNTTDFKEKLRTAIRTGTPTARFNNRNPALY